MKLSELVEAQPALQRLANEKMPVKVAYAIAKNLRAVKPEVEAFEETRLKLLEENWELDPNTNQFKIPPEDQEKWQQMAKELLDTEVDIKVYIVDLATMDGTRVTPNDMAALSWMFTNGD
jgi:hypothetical protein